MEIILLEKIRNLGNIGDKVSVKSGYARNYLIPYGKAVMATAANIKKFESKRAELEKQAAELLVNAQELAAKLVDVVVTVSCKATEEGKLFGSITGGTIATALNEMGYDIQRSEVSLSQGPIRQVGEYEVTLLLHTDVTVKIKVNVIADRNDQ